MRTLAFNNVEGLLVGTNNSLIMLVDLNALVDKVKERLNFFLGEWFLNSNVGVPYFQQIFEKPLNSSLIVSTLNAEILKEPDVITVTNSVVEYDEFTRNFGYRADVETIYGSATVESGAVL